MNSQLYNIYTKLKNIESHIGGEGGELDDYDLVTLSTILTGNSTDILDENMYNLNNYNINELTKSEYSARTNCYSNIIDTNLKLVKNKESLHILNTVEYNASVLYTYIGKLYNYIIITYDNIINFDINEHGISYQLFDDHLNIKKTTTIVPDAITFKNTLNLNSYSIIGPNVFSETVIDEGKSNILYYNTVNNNITAVNNVNLKSSVTQISNPIENKAVKLNSNNDIITHIKNGKRRIEYNNMKSAYYNSDTHNMYTLDNTGVIKKYTLQDNSLSFIECEQITTKTVPGIGLFVDNNDVIITYDHTHVYTVVNDVIYSIEVETDINHVKLIHDRIVLVGCKDGTAYTMTYSEHEFVITKRYKPTKGAITKIHTMEYADYIIWGDHAGFAIYNIHGIEVYSMNNAVAMTVLQYNNLDSIVIAKNGKYEVVEYDSNLDTFELKNDVFNLNDYIPYSVNANKLSKTKFMTDEAILDITRPDIVYHIAVSMDVNLFDKFIGYISEIDRIIVVRKNTVVIEPINYILPSDKISTPSKYTSGMELAYNDVLKVFQFNNASYDLSNPIYVTKPNTLTTQTLKDSVIAYDGYYTKYDWQDPRTNDRYDYINAVKYGTSVAKDNTFIEVGRYIYSHRYRIFSPTICDDSTIILYSKYVDNDIVKIAVADNKNCNTKSSSPIKNPTPYDYPGGKFSSTDISLYPCPNNKTFRFVSVSKATGECILYHSNGKSEKVSTKVFGTPYNSEYMGIYDNWIVDANNRFGCNNMESDEVSYYVKGSVGPWAILYHDKLKIVTAINLDTYETRCINSMQINSCAILPNLTACVPESNSLRLNHPTDGPSVILSSGVKNIYKVSQYKMLYTTDSNKIYMYDNNTNARIDITTKFNIITDFDKVIDIKINNKYIIIATDSLIYLFNTVNYTYINTININNIHEIVLFNDDLDVLIVSDGGLYKLLSTTDVKNIDSDINQNNSVQPMAGTEFFTYFKDSVVYLAIIDGNNSISIINSIDTAATISNYRINKYGILFTNNSNTKLDIKKYDIYSGNIISNNTDISVTQYTILDTVSDNGFIFIDHELNTINALFIDTDNKSNIIPIHQIDGNVDKGAIHIDNTLYYIDRHNNLIELTDCLSIYNK